MINIRRISALHIKTAENLHAKEKSALFGKTTKRSRRSMKHCIYLQDEVSEGIFQKLMEYVAKTGRNISFSKILSAYVEKGLKSPLEEVIKID